MRWSVSFAIDLKSKSHHIVQTPCSHF